MRVRIATAGLLFAIATLPAFADEPAPIVVGRSLTLLNGTVATPGAAPFADGESLTHALYFRSMTVGTGTMSVETGVTYDGHPAIRLSGILSASPVPFVEFDAASESWIDPEGLFSLGFVSDEDGPRIEDRQEWRLDNERGMATRDRVRKKGSGAAKSTHVEKSLARTHVQDALSMLYFFRAFPVTVGDELESDVFVSKKLWSLKFRVVKREKVKVPAGKFTCLKVVPEITRDGETSAKGQVTVWVTDDERKIPVKVWSHTTYGTIEAALLREN